MKGLLRATAVVLLLSGFFVSASSFSVAPNAAKDLTQATILSDGPSPSPEWPTTPRPTPNSTSRR